MVSQEEEEEWKSDLFSIFCGSAHVNVAQSRGQRCGTCSLLFRWRKKMVKLRTFLLLKIPPIKCHVTCLRWPSNYWESSFLLSEQPLYINLDAWLSIFNFLKKKCPVLFGLFFPSLSVTIHTLQLSCLFFFYFTSYICLRIRVNICERTVGASKTNWQKLFLRIFLSLPCEHVSVLRYSKII